MRNNAYEVNNIQCKINTAHIITVDYIAAILYVHSQQDNLLFPVKVSYVSSS